MISWYCLFWENGSSHQQGAQQPLALFWPSPQFIFIFILTFIFIFTHFHSFSLIFIFTFIFTIRCNDEWYAAMMKMNVWWRRGRWARDLKQRARPRWRNNQLSTWPQQLNDEQSRQPRWRNLKQRVRPQWRDNQLSARPRRRDMKRARNLDGATWIRKRGLDGAAINWARDFDGVMIHRARDLDVVTWIRAGDLDGTRQRREASTCLGWPMKFTRNRGSIKAE